MPTFDRADTTWGITPDLIDIANVAVERIAVRKASVVPVRDIKGHTIGGLIRTYLQAHIRRMLTFIQAGCAEIAAGRSLVTNQCVRAIYENVACVCDYADQIIPMLEKREFQNVADFASARAFATRLEHLIDKHGPSNTSTSILTQIDKMVRRHPGYREAYDHLSEIVHPNGLGAVVYYVKLEDGRASIFDDGLDPSKAKESLIVAATLLLFAEASIAEIETKLATLYEN
jgi:hypothetical protein